jgi:hypothetical protein
LLSEEASCSECCCSQAFDLVTDDEISVFAAMDKVSEVKSRLQSGQELLNGSSTTLSSLQSQNSTTTMGLLSSVLTALDGGGGGVANNPIASLVSSADLSSESSPLRPPPAHAECKASNMCPQEKESSSEL